MSLAFVFLCFIISPAFAKPSSSSQTHMLVLKCANTDTTIKMSRLAVLDISEAKKMDFALVTGHALPLERPCFVQDFEGRKRDVELIDYAQNFKVGTKHDWAVISFRKMKTKNLIRYPLSPITDHITDFESTDIFFAEARGLPENSQNCRLLPFIDRIKHITDTKLPVYHNCHAVHGQSGSPLTTLLQNQHYLVGLHIGQSWYFKSPYTGRPENHGYVALFGAEMVSDINRILNTQVTQF